VSHAVNEDIAMFLMTLIDLSLLISGVVLLYF